MAVSEIGGCCHHSSVLKSTGSRRRSGLTSRAGTLTDGADGGGPKEK